MPESRVEFVVLALERDLGSRRGRQWQRQLDGL